MSPCPCLSGPVLLIGLFLGFKLWHFYRHRMESGLPLVVPGPEGISRIFTGKQKRNLTRGGMLLVFVGALVIFFGQVPLTRVFYAAREALLGGTITWGW